MERYVRSGFPVRRYLELHCLLGCAIVFKIRRFYSIVYTRVTKLYVLKLQIAE